MALFPGRLKRRITLELISILPNNDYDVDVHTTHILPDEGFAGGLPLISFVNHGETSDYLYYSYKKSGMSGYTQ